MDAWMQNEQRDRVAATRKRPAPPHRLTVTALGEGGHGPEDGPPPTELLLETTDPTGEIAEWLDDVWLMEALRLWGDRRLVIRVLPSEAALLHPVVLHQLTMFKRVAPNWRAVGYGYCGELCGEAAVEALACSAYDEVHLVEGARSMWARAEPAVHSFRIEDLFKRIRQNQRARGVTRPILVRATSLPGVPGEIAMHQSATSTVARQPAT